MNRPEHPSDDPPRPGEVSDRVRRRLDDVFGDVLPDVTRDETESSDDPPALRRDDWLHANRPPHHDDRG